MIIINIIQKKIEKYKRLLEQDISIIPENEISSSGYIVSTLEAGIWCTLNSNNYKESVLKAVNLGYDTDTNSVIVEGINGTIYGKNSIPKEWLSKLKKENYLEDIAKKYSETFKKII